MNVSGQCGASRHKAVADVGVARFSPFIRTSMTAFIGLLPFVTTPAPATFFIVPMAISLAFGVLFALFVTLALVPALYAIGEDMHVRIEGWKLSISRFFSRVFGGGRARQAGE